jgi:heme A synthase
MNQAVLMTHVFLGVLCLLASVWLFVEVIHASDANLARIRKLSAGIAIVMWLCFIVAGYWYVNDYAPDKAIILKGPWRFAHNFFMETKEHVVIILLLVATYLPIASANDLVKSNGARNLVLWVTGLFALITLSAEGMGAMVAMGVKVALLPK